MSRSDAMLRSGTLRIRGSRRAETITQRLVRTMPERGPSGSTTRAWLAQNLRLAIMAAAAIAAVALSLGTSTQLGPRTTLLSRPVGHQSLFASSSYNGGGISISHRPSRRRTTSVRVLADEEEEGEVVSKPLVAYETQLELYLCNPSLVVDGNDAYTVDEARLAAALGRIAGLGEVRILPSTCCRPTIITININATAADQRSSSQDPVSRPARFSRTKPRSLLRDVEATDALLYLLYRRATVKPVYAILDFVSRSIDLFRRCLLRLESRRWFVQSQTVI